VETELRDGFADAGVDVPDEDVRRLADAIDTSAEPVSAAEILA
jgi:hypothetical protein